MARKFSINGEAIRQLAEILQETDLSEIEYEDEGCRIRVARTLAAAAFVPSAPSSVSGATFHTPASSPSSVEMTPPPETGEKITSPIVGMAYRSPEPGSPPFIKEGDTVSKGQTLLIIEAMKVMNPLKAPRDGVIKKILVQDSQPVEFSEVLMIME
jgi:acetyl-CoA carboxylase biotin carboxyl carrier protein